MGETSFEQIKAPQLEAEKKPELEQLFDLLSTQKPKQADAIVWIENGDFERAPKCKELLFAGFAEEILAIGPGKTSDISIQTSKALDQLRAHGWKKILLVASPQRQAAAFLTLLKLAREQNFDIEIINQPTKPIHRNVFMPQHDPATMAPLAEAIEHLTSHSK